MRTLFLMMLIFVVGCDAKDAAGFKIDLSQLNWQTGAIIALALLVNPGKIVKSLTEQLGKLPGLEKLIRMVGLVKTADDSPNQLTAAETLEALVAIVNRMPQSPLRDEIASLLGKAAKTPEAPEVLNAGK